MLRQPIVANFPVYPFNISILLWLTRLDIFKLDALFLAKFCIVRLMFSSPLSHRITSGFPRQEMICFNARITRSDGS